MGDLCHALPGVSTWVDGGDTEIRTQTTHYKQEGLAILCDTITPYLHWRGAKDLNSY